MTDPRINVNGINNNIYILTKNIKKFTKIRNEMQNKFKLHESFYKL